MKAIAALMLTVAVVCAAGCNKKPENPDDSEQTVTLTGLWYANDQWFGNEHDRAAMDFVNSNTVIWYGTVSTNKNAFQNMEGTALDGCAGWYYFSKTYYTYVLTDNKIVFNDRIFTVFEDYLVEDGSSSQWKPWDDGNGGNGGGNTPATVTVTTYNPTDITSTGATCCADVTAETGSDIRELGICWGTSAYPTAENSHLSTTTWNVPFVCTISDLVPETKYHVRAYALNGTSYVYGDDKSFTTLAEGGGGGQTFSITATANPSNGGTVIGSGIYQEGQQCTIIATANADYDFVNWTENGAFCSMDESYSFVANSNRSLVANFTYIGGGGGNGSVPTGAINGRFTINSSGYQVYFSQGNLQYIGSASPAYWKFAENQYDYLGTTTGQDSDSHYVDRDLFGWGTSGYAHGANCYQPWSTSINSSDYYAYGNLQYNLYDQNGQADWGYNAISNGGNTTNTWRTLTGGANGEWNYVFNERSASTVNGISNARFAKACVNGVYGVVLFPDSYTHPSGVSQPTGINETGNAGWNGNNYTAADFGLMQDAGAVFLPAAGYRNGTSVYAAGTNGFYWSSTYNGSRNACRLNFHSGSVNPQNNGIRNSGFSVRLVCPAE